MMTLRIQTAHRKGYEMHIQLFVQKLRIKVTNTGCVRLTVWFTNNTDLEEGKEVTYWPSLDKALAHLKATYEVQS